MFVSRHLRPRRRVRALLVGATVAVGALVTGVSSAQAEQRINWYDFHRVDCSGNATYPSNAPSGEDRIHLREECTNTGVPSTQVEIVLKTSQSVTWRKGIEFDRGTGCGGWFYTCGWTFLSGMYLQDADHGPVARRINLSDITAQQGGRLRFGKAKLFGVYTSMYDLRFDAAHRVGARRYTFTWQWD